VGFAIMNYLIMGCLSFPPLRNDDVRLSRRRSRLKGTGAATSVSRLSSFVTQPWILAFIDGYIPYMQNYSKLLSCTSLFQLKVARKGSCFFRCIIFGS